jgi:hypothetical protein
MSPEVVVDAILDGLRHRQPRIYPGRRTSMLAHLVTGAPELATRYANWAIRRDEHARARTNRPGTMTGLSPSSLRGAAAPLGDAVGCL